MEMQNLMDTIIRTNKFHLAAPFADIRNHLYLQVERWIDHWRPGQGKCYSYFSSCCKHGCTSYIQKENALRARLAFTDLPAETFDAGSYDTNFDTDLGDKIREDVMTIATRWHEPAIVEVLQFLVEVVMQGRAVTRRRQALATVTKSFGIADSEAAFLLDWAQAQVRSKLLDHYDIPIGDEEAWRCSEKYSHIPDLMKLIGVDATKRLMAVYGGKALKLPSPSQIRRVSLLKDGYQRYWSSPDPEVADGLSRSLRVARQRLETDLHDMARGVNSGITFDKPLFND
jgi:hypothetical protein